MEHYSTIKKNETLPLATTLMDLKDIIIITISQTEKRQILYDFIHMWDLKNKTKQKKTKQKNEQTKQKRSHRYREQTGVCRGEEGGELGEIDDVD